MSNGNEKMQATPQAGDMSKAQEQLDPKLKHEIEGFQSILGNTMYDNKMRPKIQKMLKDGGPPEKSIPATAKAIADTAIPMFEEKAGKVKNPVLVNGAVFLVQELALIGNTSGYFNVTEDMMQGILQTTIQTHIEEGLRNKTIDVMELQAGTEELMTEEDRALGLEAASVEGVPPQAGGEQAMEAYASQRENAARKQTMQEANSMMKKGQLAQAQQANQQQGGQ